MSEPLLAKPPRIIAWELQRKRMADGEIVPPEEWVDPPRIRPGVVLRSATDRKEGGGDGPAWIGKGGVVWSRSDDRAGWSTIEQYRGKPYRYRVADDDIDWGAYSGIIDCRVVEGIVRAIGADMGRRGAGRNGVRKGYTASSNLGALTRLTAVLETPGMDSNADSAVA